MKGAGLRVWVLNEKGKGKLTCIRVYTSPGRACDLLCRGWDSSGPLPPGLDGDLMFATWLQHIEPRGLGNEATIHTGQHRSIRHEAVGAWRSWKIAMYDARGVVIISK